MSAFERTQIYYIVLYQRSRRKLIFNNVVITDDTQTPNKLYCCQLYT